MKKQLLLGVALLTLASCESPMDDPSAVTDTRTIRFEVQGDFDAPTFTRAGTAPSAPSGSAAGTSATTGTPAPASSAPSGFPAGTSATTRAGLSANGKSMTDLWLFDYMNGTLVQQLHQSSTDADFGSPEITLDYGAHHIYFVASRGTTPTVSTDSHTITWATSSDTFYKDLALDVTSGSAAAHAVTMTRVATKLGIIIADAIPEGLATVTLTPTKWYYGIDYLTGLPTDEQETPREITLPATQAGKTNTTVSIFGLSGTTEWTTNVSVVARDGEDDILGQATITDAPFKANRATNYSGNLFGSNSGFTITLTDTWDDAHNGTW